MKEVLNLGSQPPANSLYKSDDEELPNVPLRLMFCLDCCTVQLGDTVDPKYLFDNYVWVTGTSRAAKEHSNFFLEQALSRCPIENPYVIEIASNDGTFLKCFQDMGCKVLGIDPARNIAANASADGILTLPKFFNYELANELLLDNGLADIIFARNVIPHVKDIQSVIAGISTLLSKRGIGIIEFHSAKLIMEELHYDSIYHEHLFYFSLLTISSLLKKYDLHIFDLESSPISGGSWIIYFSKDIRKISDALKQAEKNEIDSGLNTIDSWNQFADDTKKHSLLLRDIIFNQESKIIAYGASARSSTLLNFCQISNEHIEYIIDKNPLKHNLLSPGSRIPIISFKNGVKKLQGRDIVLLLAWNLEKEIINELKENGFEGKFIMPLPNSPRLV